MTAAILAFIFVIGILVFIHELGHFAVAKWVGVRVEKFSLGFGKKLFGFTRGETEYLVSLLPLGGYVKMYGEGGEGNFIVDAVEPGSHAEKAGFRSGDRITGVEGFDFSSFSSWGDLESFLRKDVEEEYLVSVERDDKTVRFNTSADGFNGLEAYSEKEYPRGFSNQSILDRFLIVVAGPFMNIVLPFLFIPIVFMIGISVPAYLEKSPVIGYVQPDSAAAEAGFKKGDKILEIDGEKVSTWREANISLQSNPDVLLNVKVKRDGEIKNFKIKATASQEGVVAVGFGEPLPAKVGGVIDGTPADRADLKKGDRILAINGKKVSDWEQMASIIKKNANRKISLLIQRGERNLNIMITPEPLTEAGEGAIGISPYVEEIQKQYGFFQSIVQGIKEAANLVVEVTVLLIAFLYKLITGKIALGTAGKSLAGPLLIAKVSGSAAESGLASLLQFTAFISINLAIINLFPIPMLDGGHVVYLTIEAIKRRPLSRRTMEISQRIGFTLLIFIMFLAIYNDIARMRGDIMDSLKQLIEAFR